MTDILPIQLVVCDIDGVLTGGETKALDHELLKCLAGLNRQARKNAHLPGVTLCSGRAAPYVELMTQAIDGFMPAVFENGAGLYLPDSYSFLPNPALGNQPGMEMVKQKIQAELIDTGFAFYQPGKDYTLTLFTTDQADTGRLWEAIEHALGSLGDSVQLVASPACVNILPLGVDKGVGLQFLARQTHLDTASMLGVGDSDNDLPFLSLVGYSAAPANANAAVKSKVQYISPMSTVDGVQDILNHFGISC